LDQGRLDDVGAELTLSSPRTTVGGRLRATGAFPFLALALVLGSLLAASARGRGGPRFERTFDSPRALAVAVLAALEAKDQAALEGLALSEQEFREWVFPEMPAWGKIPMEYVWGDLRLKSGHTLGRILASHGGRDYVVENVVFDGGASAYETFVVHRKPRLLVRDRATGERGQLAILGSVIEDGERYKLFSYVVNR
jgi:hypothetical protein